MPSAKRQGAGSGGKQSGGIPATPGMAALFRSPGQRRRVPPQAPLPGVGGQRGDGPPLPPGAPHTQSESYLQSSALAGTRAAFWQMIPRRAPSGNPGTSPAPSRAGTLSLFRTTGTTLKQSVLQPLDTRRDRPSCSSLRLSTLREPAMGHLLSQRLSQASLRTPTPAPRAVPLARYTEAVRGP